MGSRAFDWDYAPLSSYLPGFRRYRSYRNNWIDWSWEITPTGADTVNQSVWPRRCSASLFTAALLQVISSEHKPNYTTVHFYDKSSCFLSHLPRQLHFTSFSKNAVAGSPAIFAGLSLSTFWLCAVAWIKIIAQPGLNLVVHSVAVVYGCITGGWERFRREIHRSGRSVSSPTMVTDLLFAMVHAVDNMF